MPRTSFTAIYENAQKNENRPKTEGGIYLNLTPDAKTGTRLAVVRLVGLPYDYYEHAARVRNTDPKIIDPKTKKMATSVPREFPDQKFYTDQNKKQFGRICYKPFTDKYGECPWCKMGYEGSMRYAMNVIERGIKKPEGGIKPGDSFEPDRVKILQKGALVFGPISKKAQNNDQMNKEGRSKTKKWVIPGGEDAPDFTIRATTSAKVQWGNTEFFVDAESENSPITPEEIELLKAVRVVSQEEIDAIHKSSPDMKQFPDWFFYGFNLEKMYAPTLKQGDDSDDTSAEDMDIENPFSGQIPSVENASVQDSDAASGDKDNDATSDDKDDDEETSDDFDPNW